jgi:sigma-B regulation protein RsbQ
VNAVLKRNNVKVFGSGQPMMFAHGFGCDQTMFRFITPAFEDRYQIVLFDHVGSGNSEIPAYDFEKYSNLKGYTNDIVDIINTLDLKDIIFVGHSVSCMIGLLAAIEMPASFSKMIFIGPSARYINEAPYYFGGFEKQDVLEMLGSMKKNYFNWAKFLAHAIMKNPEIPELADELAESFCSTDPVIARQFAEVTFLSDNRSDLPKLKIPTLLLQCSDDMIAPLEVGHFLSEQIPDSTLRIMKATGHCPHMSAPGETITLIKEYLENVEEPSDNVFY